MQDNTSNKNINQIIVTTSWDDGHPSDIKLAEVLTEFGIKGTFYIAPRNREREVLTTIDLQAISEHFEVGAHTKTHPDLRSLSDQNLQREIVGSKTELEDLIGAPVKMFCYPRGKYNRHVRNAVLNAGFLGARTTREFFLNPGTDALQLATTISVFPLPNWIRIRHELKTKNWHGLRVLWRIGIDKSWKQLAHALFENALEKGGVWHLWGHSWEIEKYNMWDGLKKVLSFVSGRKDVAYLTNSEIVNNLGYF